MAAGYVVTYREGGDPEREPAIESGRMLLGGLTEPKDVALTVGHVALDATAMIGTVIHVDGGFTAR